MPTAVFAAVPFFLAAIPLLIGVTALYGGTTSLRRSTRLRRTGARAEGLIVDTVTRGPRDAGTADPTYPVVTWTTADGRPMHTRSPVGVSHAPRFEPGARVTVCYDPANPTGQWIIEGYGTTITYVIIGAGVLCLALGAGLLAAIL